MERLSVNVQTGEVTTIPLTQEEMNAIILTPPAPFVPQTVSRYQGREAMRRTTHGTGTLFEAVEALIAASEIPELYKDAWAEIQTFVRTSPMLNALADMLGLTEQQRDDLFILAYGITV